nr:hypothetical protein [Amycolatopsis oliviviridis]
MTRGNSVSPLRVSAWSAVFVRCVAADAADEQVADHPELAHGRGKGERVGDER